MNFFKLYIGDYQRDTAHLSVTEHGAYLLMLQHYYATEKPLPVGKALHRMLRAQDKAEREAIDVIVAQFWRETQGGLVNDRASIEIGKAEHQRTVNREVGKLGGRPKQTESVKPRITGSVTESQPIDNPPQTPDSRHQTEIQGSVCVNGIPEPPHTHTPIPTEYRDRARTSRPDLNPDAVWQDFCGHYAPDKRTANRWDKWLAREETPGTTGPNGAGMDPDSKGAVTALGIELGLGQWDELKEPFPAYKARVRQVQFQQSSRGA